MASEGCSSVGMTEKTEGGGREGGEGGAAAGRGREPPQQAPPRSYSEFMRNLAAKYNNENPAE